MKTDNTPVLVAVGQYVMRERATETNAKSPADLAALAAQRALQDCGCAELATSIDIVAMVRTNADSVSEAHAKLGHPFGSSNNMPLSVAHRIGAAPTQAIYSEVGGQSPQRLINEFAGRIYNGECGVVLICGAEATATTKQALKAGLKLEWEEFVEGPFEDRGIGSLLQTQYELGHGVTFPLQVYPLFEQAWRYRHGFSSAQHSHNMAALFAPFSQVAAANPYAQFPVAWSEDSLAQVSADNYLVSAPYTRWLVAQETVNQSAAVVLTSVGKARELGISSDRWVYLHGYADADDLPISERPDLGRSLSLQLAANAALDAAGKAIDEIDFVDLYSCFPIAVFAACEALNIDWRNPRVPLTVTGGLPFFGGPGNNYSLHAIAEMVMRLRNAPQSFGLVIANGGFLSKHSAGVYSALPPLDWAPCSSDALASVIASQPRVTVAAQADGACRIETYAMTYANGEPNFGYVVARDSSDQRVLAKVGKDDAAALRILAAGEPIGQFINVITRDHKNYFHHVGAA